MVSSSSSDEEGKRSDDVEGGTREPSEKIEATEAEDDSAERSTKSKRKGKVDGGGDGTSAEKREPKRKLKKSASRGEREIQKSQTSDAPGDGDAQDGATVEKEPKRKMKKSASRGEREIRKSQTSDAPGDGDAQDVEKEPKRKMKKSASRGEREIRKSQTSDAVPAHVEEDLARKRIRKSRTDGGQRDGKSAATVEDEVPSVVLDKMLAAAAAGAPAFDLQKERDELRARKQKNKMSLLLGGKWTKEKKRLSLRAFELGADMELSEEQLDEVVLKMHAPRERGGLPRQNVSFGKGKDASVLMCFSGHDATHWIQQRFTLQQKDAIQRGQTWFVNRGVFRSVSKSHSSFHNSKDVFYRLAVWDAGQKEAEVIASSFLKKEKGPEEPDSIMGDLTRKKQLTMFQRSRNVLNLGKLPVVENLQPSILAQNLVTRAIKLLQEHNQGTNATIDWEALTRDQDYIMFSLIAARLQRLPVDFQTMPNDEKIVFFMNLFNALRFHSFAAQGVPTSMLERKRRSFCAYEVGGVEYTADMIYAILRGTADPEPSKFVREEFTTDLGFVKQKKMKDIGSLRVMRKAQAQAMVEEGSETNPEIHFVLFNGTNTSPPLRVMTTDRLNNIEVAVRSYVNRTGILSVDTSKDIVFLPKFLETYRQDFGDSDQDIVLSMLPLISDAKVKRFVEAYSATMVVKFDPDEFDEPHLLADEDELPSPLLEHTEDRAARTSSAVFPPSPSPSRPGSASIADIGEIACDCDDDAFASDSDERSSSSSSDSSPSSAPEE